MTYKLTIEPDWPNSDCCPAYSLQLLGGEPNQSLAASALVPRDKTGPVNLTTRSVVRHLLWRLHAGQVRRKYRNDPAFGRYRYTWDPHEKLAQETGLSAHQVKRELERLTKNGIIYRVRKTTTEPNSYRLTDEAFKLLHILQFPIATWEMLSDDGAKDFAFEYRKWFPELMQSDEMQQMLLNWHQSKDAKGQKIDPDGYGFVELIWNASHKNFEVSKKGQDYEVSDDMFV